MSGISAPYSGTPSPLYKPIDSSKYEIRLLQIPFSMLRNLGQEDPQPLTAKLIHHTLPTAATSLSKQFLKAVTRKHYIALSYVWGDPSLTEEIIVDGHKIPITYSLYSALRQFQCDAFGEETIWVDALCINQADDAEKSAQIRNMREVYHNAGNVRVWLGSAKGENDQVYQTMQYIQILTNGFLPDKYAEGVEWWETNLLPLALRPIGLTAQTTLSGWHKINMFKETFKTTEARGNSTLQGLAKTDESKFFKEFLEFRPKEKHLKKFLDLVPNGDLRHVVNSIEKYLITDPEWFNRIWVVQEVGVAWEDIEVCRGAYNISWDALLNTIFYLHFTCNARFPSIDKVIGLEVIRLGFREGKRKHLRELMHECRFRRATNPRDQIYGLYGLMNDQIDAFLQPDYTKSVEEVFAHTTLHFMHQTNSLDPICRQQTTNRNGALPTWVPDFELNMRDAAKSLLPLHLKEQPFHASGHDERCTYNITNPRASIIGYATLPVKGIRIGRVSLVSTVSNITQDISSLEKSWRTVINEHLMRRDDLTEDKDAVLTGLEHIKSRFKQYVDYQASNLANKEKLDAQSFSNLTAASGELDEKNDPDVASITRSMNDSKVTLVDSVLSSSTTTLVQPHLLESTTTIIESHHNEPYVPTHPLLASYIHVLLTGRSSQDTRLTTPQLPPIPRSAAPSTSRSTTSSRSSFPAASKSQSSLSLNLDTTLHRAFGSSKAPSKSSSTLAESVTSVSSSSFSRPDAQHASTNKSFALEKEHEGFVEAMSHLESSVRRKRFFIISGGGLGSAAENIREGDEVFVLFGCSVPVVLRHRSGKGESDIKDDDREESRNGENARPAEWEFVSEAFVDGFMDGEALAWLRQGRWERGVEDLVLV